jgi:hypothetical protein
MAFSIEQFYSNLPGGGARPALFEVQLTIPVNERRSINLSKFQFLCRATNIPSSTLNIVEQTYFGRALKFAGNRTFEDWPVTIINDEDYSIRDGLEEWSRLLNEFVENKRNENYSSTSQYKGTGTITHFGKTGDPIRRYEVNGLIPSSIEAMPLDWSTDEIQTFGVTFAMDYFKVIGPGPLF